MQPADVPRGPPQKVENEPATGPSAAVTPAPAEQAEVKKRLRSPGPYFSGQQVQDMLKALEREWERTGGFDTEYLKAFLQRLHEEEPPFYIVYERDCQRKYGS
jgi:hypothetical protein